LLLTGESISADEAFRIGLVDRVVPGPELAETAGELARRIVNNAPLAVRYCLESVRCGELSVEAELFGKSCGTQDMKEGTRAFLEKRAPRFEGK
jgi:enoyl-CoA hydratase